MDLVARVIWRVLPVSLFFIACMAVFPSTAQAYGSVPRIPGYCWDINIAPAVKCASSASGAANTWSTKIAASRGSPGTTFTYTVQSSQQVSVEEVLFNFKVSIRNCVTSGGKETCSNSDSIDSATAYRQMPTNVCPNSAYDTAAGGCECALNFKPATGPGAGTAEGACERYDCPAKGSYSSQVSPDVKMANAGDSYCNGGCTVTPSSWKVDQEGQIWGVWPFKSANQSCGGKKGPDGASSGDDKPQPAPVACSANQCPGSVNGVDVCVPCKSATTPGPSSSASGAQPGDPPKDPADPDSAVKGSTSQTTCVGAVCTTVTKYFDGKGNEVGSKTDEQSETDYCQKNPSASQCKKDSFGGACDGGFLCEGDAIQCALAKEVHVRNCQWFKDPSQAILDAGNSALAGGDRPPGHPAGEAEGKTFSLQNLINRQEAFSSGCPADRSFAINGAVYVVALSRACPLLDVIGRCVEAMCLLAAVGIVFRGS